MALLFFASHFLIGLIVSREINSVKKKRRNKITIQNEAERVAKFIQKIWF